MPIFTVKGEMDFEIQVEAKCEKDVLKLLGRNLQASVGCGECAIRTPGRRGWTKDEYMEILDYNYDAEDLDIEEDEEEDNSCPVCYGSGGGEGPNRCLQCGGKATV